MDTFADNNILVKNMMMHNNKPILLNINLIQKQYHVYYLYRIICKYFPFFKSMSMQGQIKEINEALLIPGSYKNMCYPLAGHLTTNELLLDKAFDLMINILRSAKFKLLESKRNTDSDIEEYLATKTPNVIINDIKELVKYVPGLSSHLLPPIYS